MVSSAAAPTGCVMDSLRANRYLLKTAGKMAPASAPLIAHTFGTMRVLNGLEPRRRQGRFKST